MDHETEALEGPFALCRMEGAEAALGPGLQRLHHARLQGPPAHQVTI
jgi:hypothetical protein